MLIFAKQSLDTRTSHYVYNSKGLKIYLKAKLKRLFSLKYKWISFKYNVSLQNKILNKMNKIEAKMLSEYVYSSFYIQKACFIPDKKYLPVLATKHVSDNIPSLCYIIRTNYCAKKISLFMVKAN